MSNSNQQAAFCFPKAAFCFPKTDGIQKRPSVKLNLEDPSQSFTR